MIDGSLNDIPVLNQRLLSFINSRRLGIGVLTNSNKTNLINHDIKDTKYLANDIIDKIIHQTSIEPNGNIIENAFICLYYCCSRPSEVLNVLKRHQTFVVSLFSIKLYQESLTHLKIIYQVINIFLNKSSMNIVEIEDRELLQAIPYSETNPNAVNLIVAFHFLTMQCLLQLLSNNIKTITFDSFINLDLIKSLPEYFLSFNNFPKWLNTAQTPQITEKHLNNIIKILNGLIKICKVLMRCSPELLNTQLKFELKLMEYEYLRDKKMPEIDLLRHNDVDDYINDLCKILPGTIPNQPTSTMEEVMSVLEILTNEPALVTKLKSMLLNCPTKLYNNPTIIQRMVICVEELNIQYSIVFTRAILEYIITNFKGFKTITRNHFQLFDLIVNKFKDLDDIDIFIDIISKLYFILSQFKQFKRIRNLSNLLFNNGRKVVSSICFELSIDYEYFILNSQLENTADNRNLLQYKVEKAASCLLNINESMSLFRVIIKYFKTLKVKHLNVESISSKIIPPLLKCLNEEHIETLFGCNSEFSETFKAALFIKICQSGDETINKVFEKLHINDKDLKLRCVYHYYNTNGLENFYEINDMQYEDNSPMYYLLTSGILLNKSINIEWSINTIYKSIEFFTKYLTVEPKVNDYEIEIFNSIRDYLKYNRMFGVLKELTIKYCQYRSVENDIVLLKLKFSLILDYSIICLVTQEFKEVEESLEQSSSILKVLFSKSKDSISSNYLLNWKLIQLQYYISVNELDIAIDKLKTIIKFISSKSEFSLNSQNGLSLTEKLFSLLSVARLNYIIFELKMKHRSNQQAYQCLKIGIKLTVSIIKKIPGNIRRNDYNKLRWESSSLLTNLYYNLIQILKVLGISRELRYYAGEFRKLNSANFNPIVTGLYHFYLSDTLILLDELEQSKKELSDGDAIVSMGIDKNLELVQANSHLLLSSYKNDKNTFHKILSKQFDPDPCFNIPISSSEIKYLLSIFFDVSNFNDDTVWLKLVSMKNHFNEIMRLLTVQPLFSNMDSSVIIASSLQGTAKTMGLEDLKVQLIDFLIENRTQLQSHEYKDMSLLLYKVEMYLSLLSLNDMLDLYYLYDISRSHSFDNEKLINSIPSTQDLIPQEVPIADSPTLSKQEFFQKLKALPESWVIITIDIDIKTNKLLISKFNRSLNDTPIYLRLPLDRMSQCNETLDPLSFRDAISKLTDIITKSNESIKPKVTSTIKTSDDRRKWWKLRFSLDLNIQELLDRIEYEWLGGFKGIFNSTPVSSKMINDFHGLLKDVLPSKLQTNLKFSKEVVQILSAIISNFNDSSEYQDVIKQTRIMEDILYYIVDSLIYKGEENAYDEINFDKFSTGLLEIFRGIEFESLQDEHIILIPSSNCCEIPWESLKCLSNKSISRMPSISSIFKALDINPSLNIHDHFKLMYLINPGGDLKRTEQVFSPIFSKNELWYGTVGEKPLNNEEFVSKIFEHDVFVYIGHGGCEAYIKPTDLFKYSQQLATPPCLLLGCSSGSLETNGIFESNGNVYNWLLSGSPMIVANLWDVTDKDIDKFSLSTFKMWELIQNEGVNGIENKNSKHIANCVKDSRQTCTLKYLNGSAPVIYGLPLYL